MWTTRVAAAATLMAALVNPATLGAQTNGFVMHCLSARAAGQGCVTRARADVPTDLFRDPGSLAWYRQPTLEANIAGFAPSLTFRNGVNAGANGANHVYPLASFGFVGPKLTPRLSWAVGMEPIGGFGSDFVLDHALLGTGQDYESFFAALKMGPALAFEVAPGLTFGVSGYATYAQIRDFRMPFTMPPSAAAGLVPLMQLDAHYPAMFANVPELTAYGNSNGFSGWGMGVSIGAAWKVNEHARVSASWSPRSRISLRGASATIDMRKQFGAMYGMMVQDQVVNHGRTQSEAQANIAQTLGQAGMDLSLGTVGDYDAATKLSEPQTAGVGLNVDVSPRLNLALEGVWMGWSAAESVMPFILTNGSNSNVNILVNADPANGSFTYPFPLHWRDSWTGKMGVAFRATGQTTLRAGYLYGTNPVPDNTVFVTFPAISEQAVTVGAGFDLFGVPIEASLVHAMTAATTGVGTGHLLGVEYQGSRTTMQQNVFTLGAVWKY
jgi:long-subunit fatty acid transport protein